MIDKFNKNFNYLGVDPDIKAINLGSEMFGDKIQLKHGYFPNVLSRESKFDLVLMFALFPQLPDWKAMLNDMAKHSKKYILISMLAKTEGQAVIDKDVSYAYYLDSGERVYQIIHNIFHVVNYCFTEMINAKKVSFYGYHTPIKGNSFRELPNEKIIRGNLLIELDDDFSKKVGAIQEKNYEEQIFKPEKEIIIDGVKIDF